MFESVDKENCFLHPISIDYGDDGSNVKEILCRTAAHLFGTVATSLATIYSSLKLWKIVKRNIWNILQYIDKCWQFMDDEFENCL